MPTQRGWDIPCSHSPAIPTNIKDAAAILARSAGEQSPSLNLSPLSVWRGRNGEARGGIGCGCQWLEEGPGRLKYKTIDVTNVKARGIGFLQSFL